MALVRDARTCTYPRAVQPAKAILSSRGISQEALARHAGTSRPFVVLVLNGRKKPSPRVLAALAELLPDVSPEVLFDAERLGRARG